MAVSYEAALEAEIKKLNEQRMYASAEMLGSLIVCKASVSFEFLEEYSKALYGMKEHQRCLQVCNTMLEIIKSTEPRNSSAIVRIKHRMANCLRKLRNLQGALAVYKTIDLADHTIESLLIMGKLSATFEGKRFAEKILREVLKRNPYCIEAALLLADMGIPTNELMPPRTGTEAVAFASMLNAIQDYKRPTASRITESPAIRMCETEFPSNTYLLKAKAIGAVMRANSKEAAYWFSKLRAHDRTFMEDIDIYAYILRKTGAKDELAALARDVIRTNPKRSECWACISMFYDMQGKRELALQHANRAVALNPRSALAYLLRGDIYLTLGDVWQAYNSYRQAWGLQKYVWVADGLVSALIHMEDFDKARVVANDVTKLLGKDHPHAALIQAQVLATDPQTLDAAQKLYMTAIEKDPSFIEAGVGLALVHQSKNEFEEARRVLMSFMEKYQSDLLFVAMGDLCFAQMRLGEALANYNAALALNKNNDAALAGVARVENALRSEEVDEEEEDVPIGDDEAEEGADDADAQ